MKKENSGERKAVSPLSIRFHMLHLLQQEALVCKVVFNQHSDKAVAVLSMELLEQQISIRKP